MNNYYDYNWMRNGNSYSSDICNPKNGFMKGNMFRSLYQPYKNYQFFPINVNSDKEKKLMELSEISFAAHDLNLYLDTHPEDQSMFLLFKDYQRNANDLLDEYESLYGPLCVNSDSMNSSFTWVNQEWPWEGKNV